MQKVRLFMVLAMLTTMMGNSVYASEITGAGTGSVEAVLNAESAAFSVTVPMSLPIHVDSDGTVAVSDEAKLVNNSYGAVKVTGVEVLGANGWSVIDFDTEVSTLKVGAKEFGFMLNGGKTVNGVLEFDEANYPVMEGANATDSDELALVYDAIVAPQNQSMEEEKIADVLFTLDWDRTDEEETPDIPDEPESVIPATFASLYGHMGEDFVNALEGGTLTVDSESVFTIDSETGKLTSTTLNGKATDKTVLIIPHEINGIRVKEIGHTTFKNFREINQIAIPNGVERIYARAFYHTYSTYGASADNGYRVQTVPIQIKLPDSVKEIHAHAFAYLHTDQTEWSWKSRLTEVTLGNSVEMIGISAFEGHHSLTKINFPDTLTSIGDKAFYHSALTSIQLPDSLTEIGESAFNGAKFPHVSIPSNVSIIKSLTFANNPTLKTVELNEGLIEIGDYAFAGSDLRTITLPSTLQIIGLRALSKFNNSNTAYSNKNLTQIINKSETITLGMLEEATGGTIKTGESTDTTGVLSTKIGDITVTSE